MELIDKKLAEIERETGPENRYWICGPETGRFLYEKALGAENVLEIGTSVGYSALWLAKAVRKQKSEMRNEVRSEAVRNGRVFTVESHKERGDLAEENFRGLEDVITLIRGHAPEVLSDERLPEMFDLVFLDATKYEHSSYFEAIYPRLREGGVLIADNVISHGKGKMMRKFLDVVKNHPGVRGEIVDIGDGLLVACNLQLADGRGDVC